MKTGSELSAISRTSRVTSGRGQKSKRRKDCSQTKGIHTPSAAHSSKATAVFHDQGVPSDEATWTIYASVARPLPCSKARDTAWPAVVFHHASENVR